MNDPLFTFEQTDNGAISGPLTSILLGRLPYIASDSDLQSGWRKRTLVTAEEAASSSVSCLRARSRSERTPQTTVSLQLRFHQQRSRDRSACSRRKGWSLAVF